MAIAISEVPNEITLSVCRWECMGEGAVMSHESPGALWPYPYSFYKGMLTGLQIIATALIQDGNVHFMPKE